MDDDPHTARENGHHVTLPGGLKPYFIAVAAAPRLGFIENEAQKAGAHAVNGEVPGWWLRDCPARFRV